MIDIVLVALSISLALIASASAVAAQFCINRCGFVPIREALGLEPLKSPEPTATWLSIFVNYVSTTATIYLILLYKGFSPSIELFDLVRIPVSIVLIDLANHVYHRVFHYPWLYKYFHYTHHANKNPSSWRDAVLIDAVDWNLSGAIYLIPVFLFKPSLALILVTLLIAMQVQITHCGRVTPKIPGLISSVEHWAHHQYFAYNYCELTTIADRLFGTYLSQDDIFTQKMRILQ